MNQRTLLGRLFSPAGFGLVLLLFLMPFVTVSCGSPEPIDATFTGLDMVVGGEPHITGTVDGGAIDASVESDLIALFAPDIDLQPLAVLAVLAALAGMAAGLARRADVRHASAALLAAATAGLTVAAMLAVAPHVDEIMLAKRDLLGGTLPQTAIQPQYGFWLAIAVLVALAAANTVAWVYVRRAPAAEPGRDEPGGPGGGAVRPRNEPTAPDILSYGN
jgi:hypothetical protein